MKSLIKYSALFMIFAITILIMLDISLVSLRKSELEDALKTSMYNVLKANSIDQMYEMDEEDMRVEFIREFANNINADSDIQVDICNISKNGLLDVQVTATFQHLNGEIDSQVIHKTMLVEEYEKDK